MPDTTKAPKTLTLDDLLTVDKARKVVAVPVPEWGGQVYVRELTALEREGFDAETFDHGQRDTADMARLRLRLAALCLSDANGKQLLSGADGPSILGQKSPGAVRRVYDAAAKLNVFRKEDADEKKVDSRPSPGGGSPSASPSPSDGSTSTNSSAS